MPRSQFTEAYDQLLELLVAKREAAGLSQMQLANALRKPQPFISKVETGVRRIDVVEFCAIARALGQDPAKLLAELVSRFPRRLDI